MRADRAEAMLQAMYRELAEEYQPGEREAVLRGYGAQELAKIKAAGIDVPDATPEELERLGASVAERYDRAVLRELYHEGTPWIPFCGCAGCQRQHQAQGHDQQPPLPPDPGSPPDQQHGSPADQHRRPSVDEPITPEILGPHQTAGLEEGQRGARRRVQHRRLRTVNYLAPPDDEDPWSPFS
jgi:hypothetical protein